MIITAEGSLSELFSFFFIFKFEPCGIHTTVLKKNDKTQASIKMKEKNETVGTKGKTTKHQMKLKPSNH